MITDGNDTFRKHQFPCDTATTRKRIIPYGSDAYFQYQRLYILAIITPWNIIGSIIVFHFSRAAYSKDAGSQHEIPCQIFTTGAAYW